MTNEVQFKITQVMNFKTPGYRQCYNSDVRGFAEIIQYDQRTMAFLEKIFLALKTNSRNM